MKKEKERVTVFKESVLKILYEYQKGTRRPRQQKNSFTAAISEIEMLPQAPDRNWIPAGKDNMIRALKSEIESLKQEKADMMNRLNFYKGLSRGLEIATRCNAVNGMADMGRKTDD